MRENREGCSSPSDGSWRLILQRTVINSSQNYVKMLNFTKEDWVRVEENFFLPHRVISRARGNTNLTWWHYRFFSVYTNFTRGNTVTLVEKEGNGRADTVQEN